MGIGLSTAGIVVKYCAETTANVRPTTGYSTLLGVKSLPEFSSEPATLETTTLDKTSKTFIPGLQDPAGALGITLNLDADSKESWDGMVTAYSGVEASGKAIWIEYTIPNLSSFYYRAKPSPLFFGGAEVNSVLEITGYVTPLGEPVWATAST